MTTNTMLHRFVLAAIAALALITGGLYLPSVGAQATINTTTLAAAVTPTMKTITLTSGSTVASGQRIVIDREMMTVPSGYTAGNAVVPVIRGQGGSLSNSHAASAIVYTGPANYFTQAQQIGPCTASAQVASPYIVFPGGNIYDCVGGYWGLRGEEAVVVTCNTGPLATGSVDQSCFIVDRPYVIVKIQEIHQTAEAGGTVTLIPRRQQSTEAPASGDALATALAETATAQTLRTFTLTATSSLLLLSAGERLGLDFTDDVPGELANVLVTFTLVPR
jgi:hypothetical protein